MMTNATTVKPPTFSTETLSETVHDRRDVSVHFIGRCAKCKMVRRVEVVAVVRKTAVRRIVSVLIPEGRISSYTGERRILADGSDVNGSGPIYLPCACSSIGIVAREVVGKTTHEECGARCMAATGPSCECSCGGRNHGAAHG